MKLGRKGKRNNQVNQEKWLGIIPNKSIEQEQSIGKIICARQFMIERNAEHKTAKQAILYALGGFDHDTLSVIGSQGNSFKTNWRDNGK